MMTYRQGQIVLVPFPFIDDFAQQKQRPALIVSANWYNQTRGACLLVPVTSNVHAQNAEDLLVKGENIRQAGLLHESVIKIGQLFTINQTKIHKSLGALPRSLLLQVLHRIPTLFTDPT